FRSPAVLDHGDVDVDDVAVLEDLGGARDAVADDVVDGDAGGLGVAPVADVGRDRALHVDDVVVADAVQFLGAHPRLHVRGDHFQHLGGQAAGDAHLLDFFGGLEVQGHGGDYRLFAPLRRPFRARTRPATPPHPGSFAPPPPRQVYFRVSVCPRQGDAHAGRRVPGSVPAGEYTPDANARAGVPARQVRPRKRQGGPTPEPMPAAP